MPNNCFCDQRGIGDPTKTCGVCAEDYHERPQGHPQEMDTFMSNEKLVEAMRDATFVAAMLDAICETDGTVDRMKARDAACRVREALQSHAVEAVQAQAHAAEPVRQFRAIHTRGKWTDVKDPEIWGCVTTHPESYETRTLYTRPQPARDAKDAARYRWLAQYPNLYTVNDLLRADQYTTLTRACDALMPNAAMTK